ncbi:MAG TPA: DUF4333 domain-containing protein [Actinomycetota bacterium]
MRAVHLLLAVAAALPATACERSLDVPGLEEQLAAQVGERLGDDVVVECPDRVPAEAGAVFECTAAAAAAGDVVVEVTQLDDEGNVEWRFAGEDG